MNENNAFDQRAVDNARVIANAILIIPNSKTFPADIYGTMDMTVYR